MGSITRKKRPTTEQRRAAVEASVVSALENLLESGCSFTELSVEQLARAAGISRSYFYMNFRDKSALVKGLMTDVGEELVASIGVWFEQPEIAGRKDLKIAMMRTVEIYEKHHAIMRAVAETAMYDEEIAALYESMMSGLIAKSRTAAARLKECGRAARGMTPEVAEALTWTVERLCSLYVASFRSMSKEKLANTLTHIIWNAFIAADQDDATQPAPTR